MRLARAGRLINMGLLGSVVALLTLSITGCAMPGHSATAFETVLVLHHAPGGDPAAPLTSKPFTAQGYVRITCDFGGTTGDQGVGGWIVPLARRNESIAALRKEQGFGVTPLMTEVTLPDMTGPFVIVMKYVGTKAWTLTVKAARD